MTDAAPIPKTPWHLWAVGVITLLWNFAGAFDFTMTQASGEIYLQKVPPSQVAFLNSFPLWVVVTWGVATWGGVMGSLLLLRRRRLAVPLLHWSFLGTLVLSFYNFVARDGLKALGAWALGFSIIIFTVAYLLWRYARAMRTRGVLR